MAFLKHNRLWKPAADLFLRANSSIKTISRNQSILTATSKLLRDRDNVNRHRRIFEHSTNFLGNGPAYYRYYSVGDREKRLVSVEELNRCLNCLENDKPYSNIHVILRAPYLCSININREYEQRFLTVFERWWSMLESLKKENDWKPTSIVFHLGALNKKYDGIIIEKLHEQDGLKSLEALVDEATTVDFCSLPNRKDVLSFLNGIRDLALDAKFSKVLHPSLIPSKTVLFKNIDKYLREKESLRKRQHDQNPSVDSDWMFMIAEEAPGIFIHWVYDLKMHYSDMNDFERDVLKRLCGLIKEGYDYAVGTSAKYNDINSFGMQYATFAHAWLLWDVDPDKLVRDIWQSWFSFYQIYSQRIGSNWHSNNLHRFTVCGALLGVCKRFRKVDSFLPVFDIWLDDVKKQSPLVGRLDPKQGKFGDIAESFTDFVYNCGVCCKYFASINRRDLIDRMEPIFLLVALDALDAFEGKRVSSTAISRYLTGLRDFRSFASPPSGSKEYSYSTQLNDKLVKYLNDWMDHELTISLSTAALLDTTHRLMVLLCRSKIILDADLWNKLLTPLRRENSRSVFDGKEQMLGIIVASYGEAMSHYSSIFDKACQFQVPNDVMTAYFELAKRFLINVDPDQGGVATPKYRFVLSVVLQVANRFNAIEEFEMLKPIWEKRTIELVDGFRLRPAAFASKQMIQMSKYHRVSFDPKLEEKLRLRGDGAFERKW